MREEIIYGINPVLEALRAERQGLNRIIIAGGKEGAPLREIRELARQKGIPVHVNPKNALNRLAGTEHHQGVLGISAATPYSTWEELQQKIRSARGHAVVLILDSIEDPHNLGSLIRTAGASGVLGIIIPKDRAVGITPAVVKASAGAAFHLPVIRVTNLATTLEELKKEGFWIVGADVRGDRGLYEMKFDMNVGLVIGSEGKGIRPLVLKKCDYRIRIPMKGKVSSLNAAISGAVILFEILRQQLIGSPIPARLQDSQT
jgi:23S rRNA (guanosine2251-2'-O)-methyltransferase